MTSSILYAGDTSLKTAAAYLAGVLHSADISFDYIPSAERFQNKFLAEYKLIILSDYPSVNFKPAQLASIASLVKQGTGLLMIGGWESFTGSGGGYNDTILCEVLPVTMQRNDDRVNSACPCLIEKACEHPILDSLPWTVSTPAIAGYNRFSAKSSALPLLFARRFNVSRSATGFDFKPAPKDPLLVAGTYGSGRVVAYAGDLAPHWVGGFADWGQTRINVCAPNADPVEIGTDYAQFVTQLVKWTANLNS